MTPTLEKTDLLSPNINLFQLALEADQQQEESKTHAMLKALTENVLNGTVEFDRNFMNSIHNAIEKIDSLISKQLAEVMHHEHFASLEGSWRGLEYLVKNSETSTILKIKLLDASKQTLQSDFDRALEFDQSDLFKKIYESEFGMPGGEPYGVLIGDYAFSHHPQDITLLQNLSGVAAASFCPFLSSASPQLFGFNEWSSLSKPRDLSKVFDSTEYIKWRQFRQTEDARFVALTMPRVLARLPYGEATKPVESFHFEENTNGHQYCWMNAAYPLATKITDAFSKTGWTTAIRGAEGGGKVENLPLHTFISDDGDMDMQCPTEIGITDRREAELSRLGFLPLSHYKKTDYAVFFGAQSLQQAKLYDRIEATENAKISTRLPYLLATSRFAHYLKVMARDKVGSYQEAVDCEAWLNRWILNFVNGNASTKQNLKAKYPLADAKIEVKPVPGSPGAYHAIAWLRPWLQMEELTASLRLVTAIPQRERA